MSSKDMKDLRKQLRSVVQELLPETLIAAQYAELEKRITARLDQVAKDAKVTLHEMNTRHKDTLSSLIRQANAPAPKKEVKDES